MLEPFSFNLTSVHKMASFDLRAHMTKKNRLPVKGKRLSEKPKKFRISGFAGNDLQQFGYILVVGQRVVVASHNAAVFRAHELQADIGHIRC